MPSATENRPPEAALLEPAHPEERYVDEQIRRTRRALKLVDLTAGMLTLVIGVLAYLLAMAVLEHWVVPGGWSPTARAVLLISLVGGVSWFSWRIFWPLLSKPINPAYAAQTIERSSPSLKNSLLNLLLLRDRRRQISRQVYQAIERQAAQRLSAVPLDSVVDRGAIIQLGRALAAIVAVCALYLWLSPKDPIASAGRLLMPWSEIAVPSRVQILDVQPGDTSAARGERIIVSAEIIGTAEDEPVRLRYSRADGQIVDQEILMSPQAGGLRFECRVPGRIAPGGSSGIQNDLIYWIEAGDVRSPHYEVTVFAQPTLVVDRIRYEYPSYTGYATREVENTGDISAVEGTIVTLSAVSNQPINTAHVDFEADGRHDLLMKSEDRQATVSFPLELRDDRRTPRHQSYVLRYSTAEGRKNLSPPKYRIDVERDYAPEIELLAPTEEILDVGLHEELNIEVEARDPDYAVHNVAILGEVAGSRVLKESLLSRDHTGRFVGRMRLVPAELGLKVGDVLEYWAAAADNRRPEPNLAFTAHQKIRVVGPGESGGGQDGSQDGQQDQEQGEGDQQDQEEQAGEDGQQGQDGQVGGAGDENEQANPDEQQSGEGGVGQEDNAPGENADEQSGMSGESASDEESNADSDGSTGGDSPSDSDDNSPAQENSDPTEDPSGGDPSEGQQKVSPEGDDDGTAFERIAEHFDEEESEQEGEQEGDSGGEGEDASGGQESAGERDGVEGDRTSEGTGAEEDSSSQQEQGDREEGPPQEDSTAPGGEMQESQGEAGAGENPGENQGAPDPAGDKKPKDKPSDDSTGAEQNDQEAPAQGEGDQESDSQGAQGGDRSGGGQEGAGQKADADGTGGAGENQAADDGGGQAAEQGEGETGTKPGDGEQAAGESGESGETGESSGDQPGEGGEQSGESGNQPGGEGTPPPDQPAGDNQNPADSSSGGQPEAGGTGGSNATPPPTGETAPGDDANLEYARQRTDLVIEKLDDQLRKQEVDEALLEKLGWTANELRRFVDRWKNLKSQAEGAGSQAEEARLELDDALRSLGLGRKRRPGFQSQSAKDKLRDLQEAYRGRTPLEYQELLRKYVKGTATAGENDE